ncbi:MAG: hypothetical protein ACKOET_11575 [Verrucomicrobiota bacterium]
MKTKNTPLIVAALALAAVTLTLTTGCTAVRVNSDGSGQYQNGLFEKKFEELEIEKSTNGYRANIKGYTSEARALAEGVAKGVAQGLKPGP